MSKWQSQCMRLPFCCSRLPNLQAVHQARIVLLLLVLCSVFPFLFASECADNEIVGPESGVVDPRFIPDDQVMALTWVSEVIPDKFQYEIGETVTVKFTISVDTQSRGYQPNKQYYLVSPYTTGQFLGADFDLCWSIIKSNIDSLEVVSEGNPATGEIEVRLYRSMFKPRFKQDDNGMTICYTPQDTTKTDKFNKSGPPLFQFKTYRICEDTGKGIKYNDSKYSFEYDQYRSVNISGKVAPEIWKHEMDNQSTPEKLQNDSFLPENPGFKEIRGGGLTNSVIKTIVNSTIEWNIDPRSEGYEILSVSLNYAPQGCSVSMVANSNTKYLLSVGAVPGNASINISYSHNQVIGTQTHIHYIVEHYNFGGQIYYNDKNVAHDNQSAPFVGKVILYGRNSYDDPFIQLGETDLTNVDNGNFNFATVSSPIVQIGFYVDNGTVPVLNYEGYQDGIPIYYTHRNGAGFYHPESLPLCNQYLNYSVDYRIVSNELTS